MIILITGANRGLGLEFTRQFLQAEHQILATCRNPIAANDLRVLQEKYPKKLDVLELNVSNSQSRTKILQQVKKTVNHIDLLINNAGIISGGPDRNYPLGELHSEDILAVFETNAISPLLMTELLLPLLEKSQNAKVVNISSKMGSIGEKGSTSNYSYCASKTALNMFSKLLALDLHEKNIAVQIFHPGWVKTDMGTSAAPITPPESVAGMIRVIDQLTVPESGKFRDYQGNIISW